MLPTDQPGETHGNVESTHYTVEGKQGPVTDGEVAMVRPHLNC